MWSIIQSVCVFRKNRNRKHKAKSGDTPERGGKEAEKGKAEKRVHFFLLSELYLEECSFLSRSKGIK